MDDNDAAKSEASDVRAALLPLVRLLARQAAREDYELALAAARPKPYSKGQDRPKTIKES